MVGRLYSSLLPIAGSLVLLLASVTRTNAADDELQGDWKVEALFRDGISLKPINGGYVGIQIRDHKIIFDNVLADADIGSLTYRTNRKKSPMQLDVYDKDGKQLEMGIYEINKGVFRLCLGSSRPTEFETKKNDGRSLFVLKRREKK